MACADVDMNIHQHEEASRDEPREPLIRMYTATELEPAVRGPLHDLLQKQPAVLGSVQTVSGLFSVGLGMIFAVTQEMSDSLFTLFRVSHLSGSLYIIAGLLSNLLFKYPRLLPVSLVVNFCCIIIAVAAVCLISIDLAYWRQENEQHLKMEVMELIVLWIEISLSSVLCFMFVKERRSKSHQSP